MDLEVIRNILVQAKTVGVEQTTAQLKGLSAGYEGVTVASQKTETATESAARKFQRLEGFLDPAARAARQLAKDISTLDQAFAQGGVSAERHAQLLNAATESAVRMSGGAAKATGVMEGLRQTMSGVSGQLIAMSAGAGPVGVFLSALGPWGVAAAVGLGAVSAAINHIVNEANRMGDKAIAMRQFSQATGLTAAEMKGIGKAAAAAGVDTDTAVSAFERFTFALDEARKGRGTLFDEIREVNPALAEQIALTKTQAEATDVLANAYKNAAGESQKMAIARAAFGRGGSMAGLALPAIADAGGLANMKAVTEATDAQIKSRSELRAETVRLQKETANLYATIGTDVVLKAENDLAKFENRIARLTVEIAKSRDDLTWFQNFMLGVSSLGGGGRTEEQLNAIKKLQEAARAERGQEVAPNRHSQWEAQQLQREMGVTPEELQSYIDLAAAKEKAAAATKVLQDAAARAANAERERIGFLGEAATVDEKRIANLTALTAAFLQNKMSAEDYERAIDAVNHTAAALTATHEAAIQTLRARTAAEREAAAAATVRASDSSGDAEVRAQQAVTMEVARRNVLYRDEMKQLELQLSLVRARSDTEKQSVQLEIDYQQAKDRGLTQEQAINEAMIKQKITQEQINAAEEAQAAARGPTTQYLEGQNQALADQYETIKKIQTTEANRATVISQINRAIADQNSGLAESVRLAEKYAKWVEEVYAGMHQLLDEMNFTTSSEKEAAQKRGQPGIMVEPWWSVQEKEKYGGSRVISTGMGIGLGESTYSQQQLENRVNDILKRGGGVGGAIGELGRLGTRDTASQAAITQEIQTLIDMLDPSQQAGAKAAEIARLKSQPETMARDQAIKSLTEQMKESTDATKDNTASQNALSGLYSRQFGQGFYDGGAAAGELIYGLDNNTGGAIDDMQKAANDNAKTQNDLLRNLSQSQISSISQMGGGIVNATYNVQSELRSGFASLVMAVKTPAGTTPSTPSGTSPTTTWPPLSPPPPHILGFARGGSFTTAGYGGDDTNVVAFRVSPQRERVTITPVAGGNAGGGSSSTINNYNNITVAIPQDTDEFRSSAMQVADQIFNQIAIAGRRR